MRSIQEIQKEKPEELEERLKWIMQRIPPRYASVDLNLCDERIKVWAYGPKKSKGLYLYGPVGTGKTFAAYSIFKTILANGITAKIGNSASILQDIRDDFKYGSRDAYYRSKFDEWIDYTGVLIVDDLGSEKPTDWVLETFYTLINTRYEHMRPTIFTSNYSIEEMASRLGDRIASRIVEMCEVMKLDGNDRRLS